LAAQQQVVFAQQQAAIARANQLQMAAIHRPAQQAPATQAPASYDAPLFTDLGDNAYGQVFSPTAPQTTQAQAHWNQTNSTLITPPTTGHGPKPSPFVTTTNQAFLTSYNQGVNLGVFNPTSFIAGNLSSSEDETGSIGSSHGHDSTHVTSGSPTSIGSSPVEHQFAYNTGVHAFVQPQQRRPSINIPGHTFGSSKQTSPYHHQGPTGAPYAAMGLVM
jgi:hypothetical protein